MVVRDSMIEWLSVQAYRRMASAERVEVAAHMYEDIVALIRSSVPYRNPNISPGDREYEVRRRVLQRGLAKLTESVRRAHGRHSR